MKHILYLGSDPTHFRCASAQSVIIHYPVIEIVPRELSLLRAYEQWSSYTHILVTSKNTVWVLFAHLRALGINPLCPTKTWIAVGSVTAEHLKRRGATQIEVASLETQEGLVDLLKTLDLDGALLFIPHSSLSRSVLEDSVRSAGTPYVACAIYDTCFVAKEPKPHWTDFDEVVFTSPSTVQGFVAAFGCLPQENICSAIGPITANALRETRSLLEKGNK
jgi:uroporphyrinogen-III synthase